MVICMGKVEVSRYPISLSSAVSGPADKPREPHAELPSCGTIRACKYDMKYTCQIERNMIRLIQIVQEFLLNV